MAQDCRIDWFRRTMLRTETKHIFAPERYSNARCICVGFLLVHVIVCLPSAPEVYFIDAVVARHTLPSFYHSEHLRTSAAFAEWPRVVHLATVDKTSSRFGRELNCKRTNGPADMADVWIASYLTITSYPTMEFVDVTDSDVLHAQVLSWFIGLLATSLSAAIVSKSLDYCVSFTIA